MARHAPAAPARRSSTPRLALGHLRRRRLVGATLAVPMARRAMAQAPWPQRPVRILVGLAPGSVADILARAVAPVLSARFGQPFVVENRTGAGGTLAAAAVAEAGDGHTLGIVVGGPTTTARALNPAVAYDPARAFAPVALLVRAPFLVSVAPDVPAPDLGALIALARGRPGGLAYGSIGPGTVTHLAVEEMKARHGLQIEHVAYRGFPEMMLELQAGRIQLALTTPFGGVEATAAGRIRSLAVTGAARLAELPAVPTVAEAGDPDFACFGWTGAIAPAGFPPDIAHALTDAIRTALLDPGLRANPGLQATEFVGGPPEVLAALQAAEARRWIAVIDRLGLAAPR